MQKTHTPKSPDDTMYYMHTIYAFPPIFRFVPFAQTMYFDHSTEACVLVPSEPELRRLFRHCFHTAGISKYSTGDDAEKIALGHIQVPRSACSVYDRQRC